MQEGQAPATVRPRLTVVLAAVGDGAARKIPEAVLAQLDPGDVVVRVGGPQDAVADDAPAVRWLPAREASTVPARWASGMAEARTELVVTTTLEFEPAAGWLEAFRRAFAAPDLAGVGGAIGPPARGGAALALWALRYAATWSPPAAPSHGLPELLPVSEIAADNACYRRAWLERYRGLWASGFWEPEVHAPMVRDGGRLAFDRSARVGLRWPSAASAFARQRLVHGRRYGGWRACSWSVPKRLVRLLGAPLVPPLLVARSLASARRAGIRSRRLLMALPWLFWFAAAWSLGEARGVSEATRSSSAVVRP